jgi:hypothetical protein
MAANIVSVTNPDIAIVFRKSRIAVVKYQHDIRFPYSFLALVPKIRAEVHGWLVLMYPALERIVTKELEALDFLFDLPS